MHVTFAKVAVFLLAAGLPAVPGHAADSALTAYAADGRALSVGAVVAVGTESPSGCVFADDAVTVVAPAGSDSTVALGVDADCRLVVRELSSSSGPVTDGLPDEGLGVRYAAPKNNQTAAAPTDRSTVSGAVGGLVHDPVRSVRDLTDTVLRTVDTVVANDVVDVQVVQVIYNEARVQEYRDYMAVQYMVNRRAQTVGTLEPSTGSCEGSYIDENVIYGPYANDILSCFYKRTANGPSKVGFVSGGTYRKMIATLVIDERKLTEVFEATSAGTTRRTCSTGGPLRIGWWVTCYFDVN